MLSVEDILQPENVSYTDSIWTWAVAHMLHKGDDWQITTITDTAPIEIVFLSKGEPLTDYLISGNTVQNGTPTPEAPVDVVGCGVRTKNVMPAGEKKTVEVNGVTFSSDGNGCYHISGTSSQYSSAQFNLVSGFTTPVSVSNGGQGTLSFFNDKDYGRNARLVFYNGATEIDDWGLSPINRTNTTYNSIGNKYVDSIKLTIEAGITVDVTIMPEFTDDGILPSEFEPYGYKLPITVNGTEYPIYLGQVQTTRRIRKMTFTGEENWATQRIKWRNDTALFALQQSMAQIWKMTNRPSINTHFMSVAAGVNPQEQNYACSGYHPDDVFSNFYYIRLDFATIGITLETTEADAITAFKSYLAAQYAAGTPVTVWYVLAEPETAVVNEPLMKIGDYADTVSMAQASVTIPTIAGTNTLLVDTTVQPSVVSITGNIKEVST